MKIRYINELKVVLNNLGITVEEICIVGSSVMAACNIRENHDLDIAVLSATRERLIREHRNEIEILPSGTINLAENIQILRNRYLELDISDEMLFESENSAYVGEFRIADLRIEIAKKIIRNYDKDKADIRKIKENNAIDDSDWMKIQEFLNIKSKWESFIKETQGLYIYGAGKYGKRLFDLIKQYEAKEKVKAFLVTNIEGNCSEIESIPVLQADKVNTKNISVLVAVSNLYQEDVKRNLEKLQYSKVINAYKYIFLNNCEKNVEEVMPIATTIDIRELLLQQYHNGEFNRYDIVVRLLELENAYQNKNGQDEFIQNEFDNNSEILVDKELKIMGDVQQIALALYQNISHIKIQISSQKTNVKYGLDWLKEHKNPQEIKRIQEKYNRLYETWCCPIKGIIWPAAVGFVEDIIQHIRGKYYVSIRKEMEFSDEAFHKFVKEVYDFDNIAGWKIASKYEHLKQVSPHRITIIDIQIPIPQFGLKMNGSTISQAGIELKKEIRDKYKDKIENYVPDVIFHTADNFRQSEYMEGLLNDIQ